MTATTQIRTKQKPNVLRRFVPILAWLPRYNRAWLLADLIAGLTLWGLVVPEGMAYAGADAVTEALSAAIASCSLVACGT